MPCERTTRFELATSTLARWCSTEPSYCPQCRFDGQPWLFRCFPTSGAIEPQFYAELLAGLGLSDELRETPSASASWPRVRARFAEVIAARTKADWLHIFDGRDACVSEVVNPGDVATQPHLAARGTYVVVDGALQPAPAPGSA